MEVLMRILLIVMLVVSGPAIGDIDRRICNGLSGETLGGVLVSQTEWIDLPGSQDQVCRIVGFRPPYLDIEVVLPKNWAGRYLQQGGGGIDGWLPTAITRDDSDRVVSLHPAISKHGAIYAASNGGHRLGVKGEAAPPAWIGDSAAAVASRTDFLYLSLYETLMFARQLSAKVYGRLPDFSYFNGASNGGRHAYIMAERWPEYFDGIVAGKETMNLAGVALAWLRMASQVGTEAELSAAQFKWAYGEALTSCDADDGVVDDLMMNPYDCDFPPEILSCEARTHALCLSPPQVATLNHLFSDIVDEDGNVLLSAYPWTDFSGFAPSFTDYGGVSGFLATGDPAWFEAEKLASHNPAKDKHKIVLGMLKAGVGHDLISIAQYVAAGKKLISWHGAIDNLHPAKDHERNFDTMMGLADRLANGTGTDVRNHARYFTVAGALHKHGGFPAVDWLSAIINWVEKGTPPLELRYKRGDGVVLPVIER